MSTETTFCCGRQVIGLAIDTLAGEFWIDLNDILKEQFTLIKGNNYYFWSFFNVSKLIELKNEVILSPS